MKANNELTRVEVFYCTHAFSWGFIVTNHPNSCSVYHGHYFFSLSSHLFLTISKTVVVSLEFKTESLMKCDQKFSKYQGFKSFFQVLKMFSLILNITFSWFESILNPCTTHRDGKYSRTLQINFSKSNYHIAPARAVVGRFHVSLVSNRACFIQSILICPSKQHALHACLSQLQTEAGDLTRNDISNSLTLHFSTAPFRLLIGIVWNLSGVCWWC